MATLKSLLSQPPPECITLIFFVTTLSQHTELSVENGYKNLHFLALFFLESVAPGFML